MLGIHHHGYVHVAMHGMYAVCAGMHVRGHMHTHIQLISML